MKNFNKNNTDNAFQITTKDWPWQSKQLKNEYSQLTDDDLRYETGAENDLLKRLETKLEKSRDDVIRIIKKLQVKTSL